MDFLFLLLLSLAVPFILPIAAWVSARRTRSRVADLEAVVAEQREAIERLSKRILELKRDQREAPGALAVQQPAVAPAPAPGPDAPRREN